MNLAPQVDLRRLRWLIQRCERAIVESPSRNSPNQPPEDRTTGDQCPSCMARGLSIVGDDAGRFVACLVCGHGLGKAVTRA